MEVRARAEVDPAVGSRDEHGRGTVQFTEDSSRPGGAAWAAPSDLYEVTKDVLDLVTVLDDRNYLHWATTFWADERIDLGAQP